MKFMRLCDVADYERMIERVARVAHVNVRNDLIQQSDTLAKRMDEKSRRIIMISSVGAYSRFFAGITLVRGYVDLTLNELKNKYTDDQI